MHSPQWFGARFVTPLIMLFTMALSTPLRADIVNIDASKDNTMYFESGSLSNGAGNHIFTGSTGSSFPRRTLVAFDIAARIPSGATINSVTLQLYASRVRTSDLRTT